MSLVLVYDTETTDLVKNKLPPDSPAQPRIVQLAAQLIKDDGTVRGEMNLIVKPEGWTIPEAAVKSHGIQTAEAILCGLPLVVVLAAFYKMRECADVMVGHNIDFDDLVIAADTFRTGRQPGKRAPAHRFCTMNSSTQILNLPPTPKMLAAGFNKPKNPTLQEAYTFFFNEPFSGAHDAMNDVRACARVYFELKRREAALANPA